MAFISTEEINDIRANANIVDIIRDYIPLTQKGKNFVGVCPFHSDHSPSMSVSLEKQIYKCFACGESGNVFTFVEKYENVSFAEAVSIVANKIGREISVKVNNTTNTHKTEYEIMDLALKYYQNNLKTIAGNEAKKYLHDRGITDEIINDYGIGLSLDDPDTLYKLLSKKEYDIKLLSDLGLININKNNIYDTFTKRIIFPLWDSNGNIVGFSGRIYRGEKDTSKYMNSKETTIFKKGETLFNYHKAKEIAKREKYILVVEGFMDAIRCATENINNVVALQGTALTKEQINLLKKLRVKVILCLDNDNAGELATLNNGNMMVHEGLDVDVIRLSGEKDPDEYILKNGIDAFKENIKNPINFFEFKMNYLKKNKNLNNSEELALYINDVVTSLSDSTDEILKEITLNKLSKEYDISLDLLKKKLDNIKPVTIPKKEVTKPKTIIKKDSYTIGAEKILFFMMNDVKYVKMYNSKLGFLDNQLHREIANEIVYYYEKNKWISLADFITYVSNNNDIKDDVLRIVSESSDDELSIENMMEYINAVIKTMNNNKIKELKIKLKNELDQNIKLEIAQQIAELKRGEV